jgi:cation diffusion facilitator CzcD-associated flavoprotein CzcO
MLESRAFGFTINPKVMSVAQRLARRHLARQVPDPELRRRLTPDYTLGCKRVLLSNDYYPALTRDNVELVTQPISEITEHGVITTDGTEHAVDVLVFGTGFHVVDAFDHLRVVGERGLTLREAWRERMQAHLGVAVAGFPNLFMLIGPNTGLGHNSMVFMIESGIRYIMRAIELRDRAGAARVGVRHETQRAFNLRLRRDLARSVWSVGGCTSWYLDKQGNNSTLWPRFTVEYWWRTRRPSADMFEFADASGKPITSVS